MSYNKDVFICCRSGRSLPESGAVDRPRRMSWRGRVRTFPRCSQSSKSVKRMVRYCEFTVNNFVDLESKVHFSASVLLVRLLSSSIAVLQIWSLTLGLYKDLPKRYLHGRLSISPFSPAPINAVRAHWKDNRTKFINGSTLAIFGVSIKIGWWLVALWLPHCMIMFLPVFSLW